MLILAWTTNDWRGPKTWSAFWSNEDTPKLREDGARYIAECNLENGCLLTYPELTLAEAKSDARWHVALIAFAKRQHELR